MILVPSAALGGIAKQPSAEASPTTGKAAKVCSTHFNTKCQHGPKSNSSHNSSRKDMRCDEQNFFKGTKCDASRFSGFVDLHGTGSLLSGEGW
jgi:hypothetical protein